MEKIVLYAQYIFLYAQYKLQSPPRAAGQSRGVRDILQPQQSSRPVPPHLLTWPHWCAP